MTANWLSCPAASRSKPSTSRFPAALERIGHWTFDQREVHEYWHKGVIQSGYQFELPWQSPPQSDQVLVHGHLRTADGRKFDTTLTVKVDPPTGDVSASLAGGVQQASGEKTSGQQFNAFPVEHASALKASAHARQTTGSSGRTGKDRQPERCCRQVRRQPDRSRRPAIRTTRLPATHPASTFPQRSKTGGTPMSGRRRRRRPCGIPLEPRTRLRTKRSPGIAETGLPFCRVVLGMDSANPQADVRRIEKGPDGIPPQASTARTKD